jgi:hypothetical protein
MTGLTDSLRAISAAAPRGSLLRNVLKSIGRDVSPRLVETLAPSEFPSLACGYPILPVTVDDIRHANLLLLIKQAGTIQGFASSIGRSHSQVSQLKNRHKHSKSGQPRVVGGDMARYIEQQLGLETGWMDVPHPAAAAPTPPPADFADRHEVSESDWALLQDVKMLPAKELDAIRARAKEIAEMYERWEREKVRPK